ncbi:hypothetical protein Pfo_005737 [Paulownia fortunei]|nr:hypothetical protein Pfo_005737 [Paulownia fortunei]
MDRLEEAQSEVDRSRVRLAEMQIELEKERFERKRVEEDLEAVRRKAEQVKSQAEGSSIAEKLHQELREYKEILKCSLCLDRRKEDYVLSVIFVDCRVLESNIRIVYNISLHVFVMIIHLVPSSPMLPLVLGFTRLLVWTRAVTVDSNVNLQNKF